MAEGGGPEFTEVLLHQHGGGFQVFVAGHGGEEVAGVGQAVAADGAEVGDAQGRAVVLADVAPGAGVQQLDAELHATGDDGDLQRLHFQHAQFGDQAQAALLGDDQPFAVSVEEHPLHGGVGAIEVHADTAGLLGIGGGDQGQQAVEEVGAGLGNGVGVPAQAVGVDRAHLAAGNLLLQALETRVRGRRTDAVQPGAAGFGARHGEGGAGELLGIQAIGRALRGILADGQGARQGLAGELVVETAQVVQVGGGQRG